MKKPIIDYKSFRFSKLNSPEFSHIKLLGFWIVYFILFFATERLIPADSCHVVHSAIDDIIPFCEIFVIPYVFWYLLIIFSLVYFLLYNIKSFKNLSKFIMITQIVAIAVYIIFPTRQDLRPDLESLGRENVFIAVIGFLYKIDTPTGVCPSLHVAYSVAILSVWLKEKVSVYFKIFILITAILICLSIVFIKQHSAVDFFAALPLCALAEAIVFGKSHYFKKRLDK